MYCNAFFMLQTKKCIRCTNDFIFIEGNGMLQVMCPFCRTHQYFKNGIHRIGSLDEEFFEEATEISCKQCERHLVHTMGMMEWRFKCSYCRSTEELIVPLGIPESERQKYIDKMQMKKRPTITLYKK